MSRYRDAFQFLAERGSTLGVAGLVERVERDLHRRRGGQMVVRRRPQPELTLLRKRRLPGPVVALLAFLLVLAVGVGAWLLRGTQSADVVDSGQLDVVWKRFSPDGPGVALAFGPGGFASASDSPEGVEVWFSPDGDRWDLTRLPEEQGFVFPRSIVASDTTWLVWGAGPDERAIAWVSADGQDWDTVDLPEELAIRMNEVFAGAGGFLATVADPFDEATADLWISGDGVRWEPIVTDDLPPSGLAFAGGPGGFVAWSSGQATDQPTEVFYSADGRNWSSGDIEVDPGLPAATRSGVWMAGWDDAWLALSYLRQAGSEPQAVMWTSPDGRVWQPLPPPAFDRNDDGRTSLVLSLHPLGDALVALIADFAWSPGDQPFGHGEGRTQAWVTRDGQEWELIQTFEEDLVTVAVGKVDGRAIGVWLANSSFTDPAGEPVVTTLALTPTGQLERVGLELQEEILADGEVTRAEFEEAIAAMAACMEARGLTVEWSVRPDGGWSMEYGGTNDAAADEAIHNLCYFSYVERVASQLSP